MRYIDNDEGHSAGWGWRLGSAMSPWLRGRRAFLLAVIAFAAAVAAGYFGPAVGPTGGSTLHSTATVYASSEGLAVGELPERARTNNEIAFGRIWWVWTSEVTAPAPLMLPTSKRNFLVVLYEDGPRPLTEQERSTVRTQFVQLLEARGEAKAAAALRAGRLTWTEPLARRTLIRNSLVLVLAAACILLLIAAATRRSPEVIVSRRIRRELLASNLLILSLIGAGFFGLAEASEGHGLDHLVGMSFDIPGGRLSSEITNARLTVWPLAAMVQTTSLEWRLEVNGVPVAPEAIPAIVDSLDALLWPETVEQRRIVFSSKQRACILWDGIAISIMRVLCIFGVLWSARTIYTASRATQWMLEGKCAVCGYPRDGDRFEGCPECNCRYDDPDGTSW